MNKITKTFLVCVLMVVAKPFSPEVTMAININTKPGFIFGPNASDTFTLAIAPGATLSTMLPNFVDLTTQANATQTFDASLSILQTMNEQRSIIGASINRMMASINNLSSAAVKTEVAIGRIIDADFALESAKLAKHQILSQSSNQMLSIANQSKNLLAQLLQ